MYTFLTRNLFNIFRAALGEACDGDTIFAESLQEFGGGTDDPVSVSVGGCLESAF